MKTILTIIVTIALIVMAGHLVLAQNDTGNGSTENCITNNDCWDKYQSCYYGCNSEKVCEQRQTLTALYYPNCTNLILISVDNNTDINENQSVSNFGMGMRQIGIWLTFNQERKAELELDLARLRLIQARIAARNNNTGAMEKALTAHENIINRVESRMKNLEARNISVEKLTALENAISVHESRIAKLSDILLNSNLTDAQKAKVEEKLAQAENVTARLLANQLRIENRNLTGMAEERLARISQQVQNANEREQNLRDRLANRS